MTREDANSFFNAQIASKKQPLRYNNFGGIFSGPIQLPKKVFRPLGYDGRDHTFLFFSYEGQRFLLPRGAVLSVAPSLAARPLSTTDHRQCLLAYLLQTSFLDETGALLMRSKSNDFP